jgi:hypothetical protein
MIMTFCRRGWGGAVLFLFFFLSAVPECQVPVLVSTLVQVASLSPSGALSNPRTFDFLTLYVSFLETLTDALSESESIHLNYSTASPSPQPRSRYALCTLDLKNLTGASSGEMDPKSQALKSRNYVARLLLPPGYLIWVISLVSNQNDGETSTKRVTLDEAIIMVLL